MDDMWLITESARNRLEAAMASGFKVTDEQQAAHIEAMTRDTGDTPRIMTVAGDKAEIAVTGVLTASPDFFMRVLGEGNTTYSEIITALSLIQQDDAITEATVRFNTPGGSVDGLFDAVAALEAFDKPLHAVVEGECASAGYALAAQCTDIVAVNAAAQIGSIGVATSMFVSDNRVTLTSTNAPKKRPDVTTDAGKAVVVEFLDSIHELFVESISAGRGKTEKEINDNFGQGAVLLARDALKSGMIDSISAKNLRAVPSSSAEPPEPTTSNEAVTMDLAKLKADHPALYAQVVATAKTEGHAEGVTAERQRVSAHLTMGESSGDMETAIAACTEGTDMTVDVQAKYMAAGQRRAVEAARTGDDAAAAAAGDNADGDAEANAGGNADDASEHDAKVLAVVEAGLGIEAQA